MPQNGEIQLSNDSNAMHSSWKHCIYTVSGKKRTNSILGITSSNTDRFTKFFHFYNLLEICNKAIVKYPIAPKTRHYTTL